MLKKIILIVISLFLALPVAANDTGSIVPVLLLFSQNGNIKWKKYQKWNEAFKDISSITQYDANDNKIAYFEFFGISSIYQYDANYNKIAYFELFGVSSIYQYDANDNKIAYFKLFGSDITQYDANDNKIAYFDLR